MTLQTIDGDPARVKQKADAMKRAAEQMERASASLRALDLDARSDAVEELVRNTSDVADVVHRASIRYRGTGEALSDYAEVLEVAQREADTASRQHEATDVAGAAVHLATEEVAAHDPLLLLPDREADRERAAADVHRARAHLAEQHQAAQAAERRWEQARADVDAAAQLAIDRIDASIEDSRLRDGFWSKVGAAFDAAAPYLQEVLGAISSVVSIAALLLCWVPVLGQVLAVVALVATLASLAVLLVQTIRKGSGWRSFFLEAGLAVLAVVPGFKAARSVSKLVKGKKLWSTIVADTRDALKNKPLREFVLEVERPKETLTWRTAITKVKFEGYVPETFMFGLDQVKAGVVDELKRLDEMSSRPVAPAAAPYAVHCVGVSR